MQVGGVTPKQAITFSLIGIWVATIKAVTARRNTRLALFHTAFQSAPPPDNQPPVRSCVDMETKRMSATILSSLKAIIWARQY